MKKQEKFVNIFDLSVSKLLFDFVNNEILHGTNISSKRFWSGFNKAVHELAPINKKLIQKRHKIQKSIDNYHLSRKIQKLNKKEYKKNVNSNYKRLVKLSNFGRNTENILKFLNKIN